MSDALTLLKKELKSGSAQLLDASGSTTDDIGVATTLHLTKLDQKFSLEEPTIYSVADSPISLKVAYFSWLNKDLGREDFTNAANEKNVEPLGFVHRSDLCSWLDGSKNEFELSSGAQSSSVAKDEDVVMGDASAVKEVDPFLKSVLSKERNIVDHNTSLRGNKNVDFSNAGEICKLVYLQEKKGSKRVTEPESASSSKKSKRPVTPIILISPSASALLTMANIKCFLEQGTYIDPNTTDPEQQKLLNHADLTTVTHVFPRVGKLSFMIVNNTDKFTKSEYWDRTCAVFTTGQTWQFKNYKWSKPSELFSNLKGYYFHFVKEPIPSTVKEWNVEVVGLDKYKRFKDAVVLNSFWDSLERALVAKGIKGQ